MAPRRGNKVTEHKLSLRERERMAVEMRRAGATYAQIAKALGWKTDQGARQAAQRGMANIGEEARTMMRALQRERDTKFLATLMPLVFQRVPFTDKAGNHLRDADGNLMYRPHPDALAALDRILRIEDRIAALYGLNLASESDEAQAAQHNTLIIGGDQEAFVRDLTRAREALRAARDQARRDENTIDENTIEVPQAQEDDAA